MTILEDTTTERGRRSFRFTTSNDHSRETVHIEFEGPPSEPMLLVYIPRPITYANGSSGISRDVLGFTGGKRTLRRLAEVILETLGEEDR